MTDTISAERDHWEKYRLAKSRISNLLDDIARLPSASSTDVGIATSNAIRDDVEQTATYSVRELCRTLKTTVREDKFLVAIVGEYSTGKSSLINVLLGLLTERGKKTEGTLPTSIVATTAVITKLVYSETLSVEIVLKDETRFRAEPDELSAYLCQPELWRKFPFLNNIRQKEEMAARIKEVRIGCRSPLLAHGVEFVDTPGLGSVHEEHAEITRRYVAQVDAALYITSVDPPMGERDKTFLQHVSGFTDHFLFVQNKRDIGDRLENGEHIWKRRERTHREIIKEVTGRTGYAFCNVSTLQAAHGWRQGNKQDREESGFRELESNLEKFLVNLRGSERVSTWVRKIARALMLMQQRLQNQKTVTEVRLQDARINQPDEADYENWKEVNDAYREATSEMIDRVRNKIDKERDWLRNSVASTAENSVKSVTAKGLQENQDTRLRVEREITRALQKSIKAQLEGIVEDAYKEIADATKQTLGKMPETLRQFQIADVPERVLDELRLDMNTDALVSRNVTYEKRKAEGLVDGVVLFVKDIFGNPEMSEKVDYTLNMDVVSATVSYIVQQAIDGIREETAHQLRWFRNAAIDEMHLAAYNSRRAVEESKRVMTQTEQECQTEIRKVDQELDQIKQLQTEMADIQSTIKVDA